MATVNQMLERLLHGEKLPGLLREGGDVRLGQRGRGRGNGTSDNDSGRFSSPVNFRRNAAGSTTG